LVSPTEGDDGAVEDGEETQGGGDIVARAKALDFLAATLQALDKSILKPDQVKMLAAFFGSMFNNDTKAGITASAKALRQLTTAKNFKPQLGVKMIQDVCQLKEDFRLQATATRLDLYELFRYLIQDPAVVSELQHEYGASSGFMVDLVQLCSHERDPKNLMVWFGIITTLLADYAPSDEVTEELFKTFSNYFPISMRSSATSVGITADDLKVALRQCFSAHQRLARLTFPYLVQRLDQGDAVTVAVKVSLMCRSYAILVKLTVPSPQIDILKTLQACIERYENPQSSLLPYIDKIWNSLKYEVRNGEVQETSDATLEVLRGIGTKLNGTASEPLDMKLVTNYIELVFGDSLEDLSNPTYTKQAGQLCTTVVSSSLRTFLLEGSRLVAAITENIRQPKSPSHTKDLLFLLNALLKERRTFTQSVRDRTAFLLENSLEKDNIAFKALFHQVYLPLWRQTSPNPFGEHTGLFKEVIKGLALLVGQQSFVSDGSQTALHSAEECREIASLLSHKVLEPLTLSANDRVGAVPDVEQELTQTLRTVIVESSCVYEPLLVNLKAAIVTRDWKAPSERSVQDLQEIIARIAYVTCSELPALEALSDGSGPNQLDSFVCLSSVLLQTFDSLLAKKTHPAILGLIVAGLHGAMLNFRDACAPLPKEVAILPSLTSNGAVDWDSLFKEAVSGTKKSAGAGLWHWLDLLPDQRRGLQAQGPQTEREHDVFADFTRLSLYAVRYLYLRVTTFIPSANDQPEDTAYPAIRLADDLWNLCQDVGCSVEPLIVQLGSMASLVIRSLDAASQRLLTLGVEGFRLFRDLDLDVEKIRLPKRAVQLDGLTLGILESLWPDAMVDLVSCSSVTPLTSTC
jgi:DNA repair/transcription protein MET18/MMS19